MRVNSIRMKRRNSIGTSIDRQLQHRWWSWRRVHRRRNRGIGVSVSVSIWNRELLRILRRLKGRHAGVGEVRPIGAGIPRPPVGGKSSCSESFGESPSRCGCRGVCCGSVIANVAFISRPQHRLHLGVHEAVENGDEDTLKMYKKIKNWLNCLSKKFIKPVKTERRH